MNPLDLSGGAFLMLYFALFFAAAFGAVGLRRWLSGPADEAPPEADPLSPYAVAYLAGGKNRAVNAAVASLVHRGLLKVQADDRTLVPGERPAGDLDELEAWVLEAVDGERQVRDVHRDVEPRAEALADRLRDLGLVPTPEQQVLLRLLPTFLMLAVAAFGVLKIIVGIERGRPVVFLSIACAITVLGGLNFAFLRRTPRTVRGDLFLERLKARNAALQTAAASDPSRLAGNDLALALGLYGTAILAVGPLADLRRAIAPPSGHIGSSCGGGCGVAAAGAAAGRGRPAAGNCGAVEVDPVRPGTAV